MYTTGDRIATKTGIYFAAGDTSVGFTPPKGTAGYVSVSLMLAPLCAPIGTKDSPRAVELCASSRQKRKAGNTKNFWNAPLQRAPSSCIRAFFDPREIF